MSDLDKDIQAFEAMRADLEKHHMGKWVVVHDGEMVDTFDTLDAAATMAVGRFGRGPYLIRQVGARPVSLPVSVLHRPVRDHAHS